MNRIASRPLSHGSHRSRLAGASVAAVLATAVLIGIGPVLQDAGLPGAPPVADAAGPHLIASALQISRLPRAGTAWRSLVKAANTNAGRPDLADQDSKNDTFVLAKALVYARTKIPRYRSAVLSNLKAVIGTEAGARSLAVGRNLPGYVIAADLISLSRWQPSFNNRTFRPWLRRMLTKNLDGDTLISTHQLRPNNWGTHAGAARVAIAAYLGDRRQLNRAARVFHGWLGYRPAYAGFRYGDRSWQCNPARPVGINPMGCVKGGHLIDGALPDDLRRGGTFRWPPAATDYPWEGMQGAVLQAELLQRAGYPAWSWSNRALLRATQFLYNRAHWPAQSDDDWQPWLIDYRYGTRFRSAGATHPGKNFGWTDWLYGTRVRGAPRG